MAEGRAVRLHLHCSAWWAVRARQGLLGGRRAVIGSACARARRGGGGAVVRDPDVLVGDCPPGGADGVGGCEARLVIGPVYDTGPGDALAGVAARYRTTVKTLLMMNADLVARLPDQPTPDTLLPPGTPLCILPCTA